MSSIDPRKPAWTPKEIRRPQDASDTSEEEEAEYFRRAAPYEVKLQLGPIVYGQEVSYYEDNQRGISELTYLQEQQLASDHSMYRKDKKGKVLRNRDQLKIQKRTEQKIKRFSRKKQEKLNEKTRRDTEKLLRKRREEKLREQLEFPSKTERSDSQENSNGTRESDYDDVLLGSSLPLSHELSITTGSKAITSLDLDRSCGRMATGSIDHSVKLWDFNTMTASLDPFRSFEPIEGHPINNCSFSQDKKHLLVCAGGFQAKVFSREGRIHYECIRGDLYMNDMANTHGHTNMVTEAHWHPSDSTHFATSSLDGTVRVWDLHGRLVGVDKHLGHKSLHKARSENSLKVGVESCAWANDKEIVVGGCSDYSLQLWEVSRGHSISPLLTKYSAHTAAITNLAFIAEFSFVSRSFDNSMKVWDLRQLKDPVHVWDHVPLQNYKSAIAVSPENGLLLAGTALPDGSGSLQIYNNSTYELVSSLATESPVLAVQFPVELNQILLGCRNGHVKVFYSPSASSGGFLAALQRHCPVAQCSDLSLSKPVVTPYSLSQFKPEYYTRMLQKKSMKEDPVLSHKPKEPAFAPSRDGRILGINTVTQHIIKSANEKARKAEEDPREQLTSYQGTRGWVDSAYQATQPRPFFDDSQETVEERKFLSSYPAQKCLSCGLKFCSCPKRRLGDDPVFRIEKPKQ